MLLAWFSGLTAKLTRVCCVTVTTAGGKQSVVWSDNLFWLSVYNTIKQISRQTHTHTHAHAPVWVRPPNPWLATQPANPWRILRCYILAIYSFPAFIFAHNVAHTHTPQFHRHFKGNPGLASCFTHSYAPPGPLNTEKLCTSSLCWSPVVRSHVISLLSPHWGHTDHFCNTLSIMFT